MTKERQRETERENTAKREGWGHVEGDVLIELRKFTVELRDS